MIVVGTTLAAYVMDQKETWSSWLKTAEELSANSPVDIHFFAAIEVDSRGVEPFNPLLNRMNEQLYSDYWTFSLDDKREEISTNNRLRHITMGQNLVVDYATSVGASHLLFMAADCAPSGDAIPKLLEVNWPIVGGEVSTYCLHGEEVKGYPFPVESHMATAAFIFIERSVFKQLKWRWDSDRGMSDDPCYYYDAKTLLGIDTYVRKDVIGKHYPESIPAIEYRGHDRKVYR